MSSAPQRDEFRISVVPDPVVREVLEDLGFGFCRSLKRWVKCCAGGEAGAVDALLKRRSIPFERCPAPRRGELKRYAKLSDELTVAEGGGEDRCGLCGRWTAGCKHYVECDDADDAEYPGAVKFWVCPTCSREKIHPHPRLYMQLG